MPGVQSRDIERGSRWRAKLGVASGAFGGADKGLLRALLALGMLRLSDREPQAFVLSEERPEQILTDDIEADQMRVPASREFERNGHAVFAVTAVVEVNQ